VTIRDYGMSKLFFDLQSPALAAEYRANPEAVMARYPLSDEVKQALKANRASFLAERTNAYLLRYYFFAVGMKDDEFVRRLNDG
jgi:Aromatic-ring-opening dioxygenase LigAB, LigA subunit